ncbi:decaprenyl-diphosphate synthase subunit 2-like [Rhagoletis pomonella]|uniref:decaprenyl-diphosphate synthase subunit 2-like n=1 Tax=Rhagoletis pomonella TaxID=28610 RepID=UPI00177B9EF2|nr:decaprenyl-diphosphate synthase subunit 2-like [Rhagoletis pomonella]XP_036337688.1 decaprenyl-diphosphate synthase subunit 2-like [Rhagoletis pomonella]
MWKRIATQTDKLWIARGKYQLRLRSLAPAATFTFPQQPNLRTLTSTSAAKPTPPKHDWNRAVSEAERIVGYPTSFLSLRWLLSDEIANVALHLRKLVGSNHPLLKTAKHLLYNGKNTMQAWGLIVLLISKAAGHAPSVPDMEQDKSAGVLHSQRALAEVTEMIRISHLVHNSLVNLQPSSEAGKDTATYEDMAFGNKIGLLTGDYLLGHSSAELANLRNQEVVELISSAVRDFSESQFVGERDEQNNPLPCKPGSETLKTNGTATTESIDFDVNDVMIPMNISKVMGIPEKEWECRNILNAGSLLGKACQGALKLAGQSEDMQRQAYLFGKHLSLAWQACLDAEPFQSSTLPIDTPFSLVSAPVLFHLEYDASLYDEIEKGRVSVENIDYAKIHKAILSGPGLEKTKALQRKHTTAAMEVLEKFPPTDARTALENIILAMQDL